MLNRYIFPALWLFLITKADPPVPFRHDQLEVFVIPHSHEDPGWKKTVDQYYEDQVQFIITNMASDLLENPTHKFIYVEVVFFEKWWNEQNDTMRNIVRTLISRGQWEFINGGWVMNDEAVTSARDIVNQMQVGHDWLRSTLGITPRIGFHIDPFGHSNMSPHLFSEMCLDAFVGNRIPWQDKNKFIQSEHMEFVWQGSRSFDSQTQMFMWICPTEMYGTAPSTDYWKSVSPDNVKEFSEVLWGIFRGRELMYSHPHLLFLLGGDFEFVHPQDIFGPFDLMIDYLNSHPEYNVTVKYATLSEYFQKINDLNLQFPVRGAQDFFTYDFLPIPPENSWWSGYFTSWPIHKGGFYQASSNLYALDVANVFHGGNASVVCSQTMPYRQNVGLVQHHDAITGTSTPAVYEDYEKRLNSTSRAALLSMANTLANYLPRKPEFSPPILSYNQTEFVLLLGTNAPVPVVFYNPLDFSFSDQIVSLSVPSDVEVINPDNLAIQNVFYDTPLKMVYWRTKIGPLGTVTYLVKSKTEVDGGGIKEERRQNGEELPVLAIRNSFYELEFSMETNQVSSLKVLSMNKTTVLSSNLVWYDGTRSGADIASPVCVRPRIVRHVENEFFSEIVQIWRLYNSTDPAKGNTIELIHEIGPDLPGNMELSARLECDIDSGSVMYTTNNNMEALERVYNSNIRVPGNYYPLNGAAWITDDGMQLCVVADRPHGVASLVGGSIEIMVGRRTLQDDYFGLGMPLEDNTWYRTHTLLIVGAPSEVQRLRHRSLLYLRNQPFPIYGVNDPPISPEEWGTQYLTSSSMLCQDSPPNLHIFTAAWGCDNEIEVWKGPKAQVEDWDGLVRLQHLYEPNADPSYSKNITLSLNGLFECSQIHPKLFTEVTLSNMITPEQCASRKWSWNGVKQERFVHNLLEDDQVTLQPMEIRSFRFAL